MATRTIRRPGYGLHPLHSILLASTIPLFLGALLSNWAYSSSYQIQWTNFAAWLVAGGLVFAGLALLWSIIDLVRANDRDRRAWLYPILILATFVIGFINALVHAKDAWAAMPEALILSTVVLFLAAAANWAGHAAPREGDRR